jgi:predicted transcriptional regulator
MNATDLPASTVDHSLVARIAISYVKKNHVSSAEMPVLIDTVYRSMLSLGKLAFDRLRR